MFKWCRNSQSWWIKSEVLDFEQKDGYIKINSMENFWEHVNGALKSLTGGGFYITIFFFKVKHLRFKSPELGVPTPLVEQNFLPKHEFLRGFKDNSLIYIYMYAVHIVSLALTIKSSEIKYQLLQTKKHIDNTYPLK